MGSPLVTARSVNVVAGSGATARSIVRDVDFSLERGETLGVVGESGSGKSMLMKALLGLLPRGTRSEGVVELDGRRIDGLDERDLRSLRGTRVALLLQDPFTMLNPLQTVGATIAESLRPPGRLRRPQVRAEVERRLGEVGIGPEIAQKHPFQLSGGMRQRVAIAAALAGNPELLIADEPTTALDVRTQAEVLDLLGELRARRSMSLILITHDLRVAFDTCDTVMVMYAGSIVERGPAAQLRDEPRHPYTAGLMAAEPSVSHWTRDLSALPGAVPAPDAVAHQCAFSPRCSWATAACDDGPPPLVADGLRATRCRRIEEIGLAITQRLHDDRSKRPPVALPETESPLLTVRGLEKTFRTASLVGPAHTHVALAGVDLDVAPGESVGLVGESGSGKTTIARSVLGLVRPDRGTIQLDGVDISDHRRLTRVQARAARRTVQVVFQDPYASLNPSLTVGRTLREAIEVRGDASDVDAEIVQVLERVNLPASYATRLPAGMSGGERQRVSIARAICLRPRLLICDEPVAALDVSVQAQVLELLRSIRAELGMAMLFITHDLAVVRQMTERVVVLNHGRMVETGPTDRVLDEPGEPYTRSLIASIPGQVQGGRTRPVLPTT